jgi:transcriptional regulator with XRE-family HTH domain
MGWNFSERLEKARDYRGWTQTELAKRSGLHITQVHKLLHHHNPKTRIATLRQLAEALQISTEYLMGFSEDMNPRPLPMREEGLEEKDFIGAVAQLVGA